MKTVRDRQPAKSLPSEFGRNGSTLQKGDGTMGAEAKGRWGDTKPRRRAMGQ